MRQKAKEERRLLYAPILKLQKGMVLGLMKSVMSENQNCQSQVQATAPRYLRFKPGKRGLNSPFTCPAGRGGSKEGSHTLPNHMTGSGQSTQHSQRVLTLRPGALLEIYFLFIVSSTPINLYINFVIGEDDTARFDSRRYDDFHPFYLNFDILSHL